MKWIQHLNHLLFSFSSLSVCLFFLFLQHADHIQHQPGGWSDISVYSREQRWLVPGQRPSHCLVGWRVAGHPDWCTSRCPLTNIHPGVMEWTCPKHTGHHRLRLAHPQDSRYKARKIKPFAHGIYCGVTRMVARVFIGGCYGIPSGCYGVARGLM